MKIETNVKKLRRIGHEVDMSSSNLEFRKKLHNALIKGYEVLLKKRCQGLAAIQVGYNESCILLEYDKKKKQEPLIIFNPEILTSIGFRYSLEGCVSEGNGYWFVKRPLFIKVRYDLIDGTSVTKWLGPRKARIYNHEYDHTKGILLQDKGVRAWVKSC